MYLRDMPSIRLLYLTNLVALSPAKHFFNGLLDVFQLADPVDLRTKHPHDLLSGRPTLFN